MALPLPLGGFFSAFSKAYVSFGAGAGTKSRRSSVLLVSQQCLGDTLVGMTEVPQHWENIFVLSLVRQGASTFLSAKGDTAVCAHTADPLVSSGRISYM